MPFFTVLPVDVRGLTGGSSPRMNQAGSGQSSVADGLGFRTGGLAGLPRDKDSNDEEHSLSRGAVEIGSDTALHGFCVRLCVNKFGKFGWEPGCRVTEPIVGFGSTC